MSYVATDIATVPSAGFDWYVLFLEDRYDDALRRELANNFLNFGRDVGRKVLAVRGDNPDTFYREAHEANKLYLSEWRGELFMSLPALLVTNTAPKVLIEDPAQLEQSKRILLPLNPIYTHPGTITNVLRDLATALRNQEAVEALTTEDQTKIQRFWGWINKYTDLKPNFYGFGLNLNQIIQTLFIGQRTDSNRSKWHQL